MYNTTYSPDIFSVSDVSMARKIILTPEESTTDQRWNIETPYVAELITQLIKLKAKSIVLDYGCGIGRIGKELITRRGCSVIGVDISSSMRALSIDYVQSERFVPCSPEMLDVMLDRGLQVDAAISIWVLQHCYRPAEDIGRIYRSLKPNGDLFVLNGLNRALPTREHGWIDDGVDIKKMLNEKFLLTEEGFPSVEKTTKRLSATSFWGAFQRPL